MSIQTLRVPTPAANPDQLWFYHAELSPAPIPTDWIIEGQPVARNRQIAPSTDGMASSYLWDCTPGRFNWFYGLDETVCLLAGAITVVDSAGTRHNLKAGDVFFFPAGSRFEWTVVSHVRKIAFLHIPLSGKIRLLQRIFGAFKRLLRPGTPQAPSSPSL
ncbi:MAG: cupin domain-containing protein [Steroidobacteraceae bacterium]